MTGAARLSRVPLRTQLLLLLLGVIAIVTAVSSLVATSALRSYLVDRVDDQLRASLARPAPGPDGPGGRERRGPRFDVAVTTLQYDAGGAPTARTAARLRLLGGPDVPDPSAHLREPGVVDDVAADRRWRVLAREEPDGIVLVAVALDGVEDTVRRLLGISGGVGLLALAVGGGLAWIAVRRSLRPLVAVEETAQAIAAGNLAVRVPQTDPRTEIGSLATSFNTMVDRFESAYAAQQRSEQEARASERRMRQLVADASHELRTPLTSIRGFAELFRQGAADDPQQLATVLRRVEEEAERMGLLVDDLLLLARLDQDRPVRQELVDLLAVAADVVDAATAVHGGHHSVRLHPPAVHAAPAVVRGDPDRLHQVVANLVSNAVAHTPAGTAVDVRVDGDEQSVLLEVRDDGPGMEPEVAARVFERFYRADSARTRTGTGAGSGLGLSIVAALVAAHGGTVEVDSAPAEGSRFRVRLPAAPTG